MSSTVTASEMSRPHVRNLLNILRHANEHYSQVAVAIRNSLRPTYHARERARSLKLRVSIEAALKLDPRQISTIPLPVIERVVTPPPAPQAIPALVLSASVVGRERELTRLSRPFLKCHIPQYIYPAEALSTYLSVSWGNPATSSPVQASPFLRAHPPASRWSMTTVDTAEREEDAGYSSDFEEGMDLSNSPGVEEQDIASSPRASPTIPTLNVAGQYPSRLEVPSSGSSSSSSSNGPITPPNFEGPKLVVSIKRKSSASDIDMDALEKRPRYERKAWAKPANKRTTGKIPMF